MTKTRRSSLIVFAIQIVMICGLGVFFNTLKEVISHNPVVNSAILAVLIGSIVYSIFAAVIVFRGESIWTRVAANPASANALKSVEKHFPDVGHAEPAHRAAAIEALGESLEWRGRMLDYASGVLIGLGLLGTFVGLMHTMAGIKDAMALVSGSGGKASASALIGGLTAPLGRSEQQRIGQRGTRVALSTHRSGWHLPEAAAGGSIAGQLSHVASVVRPLRRRSAQVARERSGSGQICGATAA